MKSLITATCITALIAAPTWAIDVPEEPEPPTTTSGGGSDNGAAIGAALLLGLIIWGATRQETSAPLNSPRPTVRPDCGFAEGKIGECQ